MKWIKKKSKSEIPLEISFSVLEEMFKPEFGSAELEKFIPSLQDFMSPDKILEEKEELEEAITALKAGQMPPQLYSLEKELFHEYRKEHPKEIEQYGVDEVFKAFRQRFVDLLKDYLAGYLTEEGEI